MDADGNNKAVTKRADVVAENTKNPQFKKVFKTIKNIVKFSESSNSITH